MNITIKNQVKEYLSCEKTIFDITNFFSALSDKTRLKIVMALCVGKMCVSEISSLLNINQTTVSHQLKILKLCSVVEFERRDKNIFYSIKNEKVYDIMENVVDCI